MPDSTERRTTTLRLKLCIAELLRAERRCPEGPLTASGVMMSLSLDDFAHLGQVMCEVAILVGATSTIRNESAQPGFGQVRLTAELLF
eukprot:CAMPEP_0115514498 /NCGR_PEP_ID=MMETSP0271-20121206/75684_1 /TAXON_ID=71861 /ORGANISM="Scrippsiella trochoidea, Strain CCMP3099" /LENGTH=87 /DNA_ID=CAMNT_0002944945 /DNA_START=152 /DNA_END=412 /DNA_ORIENTATION=+